MRKAKRVNQKRKQVAREAQDQAKRKSSRNTRTQLRVGWMRPADPSESSTMAFERSPTR